MKGPKNGANPTPKTGVETNTTNKHHFKSRIEQESFFYEQILNVSIIGFLLTGEFELITCPFISLLINQSYILSSFI